MSRITRRTIIPVNQITPLTHRDGVTYIQMLTELSEYIKSILHPSLQHTVDQVVADVEAQMDKHHDQYVDGVQEFQRIHDTFMADVNASLIALNDSAVSDLVDDETSLLGQILNSIFATKDELGHIDIPTVYTVGEDGDYQTINEALADLSTMQPLYNSGGTDVELRLLSGFVMSEQVYVEKHDFGWVKITAEDPVVPIRRSAITQYVDRSGRAAFLGRNNAVLPYISCLFQFDTSGEELGQHGCALYFGSSVTFDFHAGITHAPARGMNVQQDSHATLFRANFSHAGEGGIRVANGSSVAAEEATATNCGAFGVSITSGATAMVNRGVFTDNEWGVAAATGSSISAEGANVSNSAIGVYVRNASQGDFTNGIADDCGIAVYARQAGTVNAQNASVRRATQQGVYALDRSSVNLADGIGHGCREFLLADSSEVSAPRSRSDHCTGLVVSATNAATVNVNNMIATNSGFTALQAVNTSTIHALGVNVSGAAGNGVRAIRGATINITDADTRRESTTTVTDIVCQTGSTIIAHNAQGGTGLTQNEVSSSGVIYR